MGNCIYQNKMIDLIHNVNNHTTSKNHTVKSIRYEITQNVNTFLDSLFYVFWIMLYT